MGLQDVKEEILNHAQKEAQAIIAEAEKEAHRIRGDAEAKIMEYRKKAEEATRHMLEVMEKREMAQAEFEVRKAMLEKKKKIIEEVMDEVTHALAKLPEKKREEYLHHLLERANKEIIVAVVFVNAKDKQAMQKVKHVDVKVKEDMLGGIIAQTADGKVSIDESYGTLLEDMRERYLPELSKILFK